MGMNKRATISTVEPIVMLNRHGARAAQIVDRLIQDAAFQIENFTAQHCELAREAYARYGKGRNPTGLDYGDCFSYALAKTTGWPLLFKGEDFSKNGLAGGAAQHLKPPRLRTLACGDKRRD